MNALRKAAGDYLELRRSLGFKLSRTETRLRQFLAFVEERKTSRITTEVALEFATQVQQLSPKTIASRLSAVRGLARYLRGTDPSTEIPTAPGHDLITGAEPDYWLASALAKGMTAFTGRPRLV